MDINIFIMPPHWMMPGAYSFSVFSKWVYGYECTSFCTNVCTYVHMCICDPVRLRLRHLYQVEFCSYIGRYPIAGASVYCGHISGFSYFSNKSIFCDTYYKHFAKMITEYPNMPFYGEIRKIFRQE